MYLYVWIDAICINQNGFTERALQVKRMGEIYSSALAVRAFLGEPSQESALEIQMLRSILDSEGYREDTNCDEILHLGAENPIWRGTVAIISSPYWLRQWIIQEIVLAPALLLSYGEQTFTADDLDTSCTILRRGIAKGMF